MNPKPRVLPRKLGVYGFCPATTEICVQLLYFDSMELGLIALCFGKTIRSIEAQPSGVLLVEVFSRRRILSVLWYRMASPYILLSSVKKAKALAQGSLRPGRGASLELPEHLPAWTEVSLGSQRPCSRKCPRSRAQTAWWPRRRCARTSGSSYSSAF